MACHIPVIPDSRALNYALGLDTPPTITTGSSILIDFYAVRSECPSSEVLIDFGDSIENYSSVPIRVEKSYSSVGTFRLIIYVYGCECGIHGNAGVYSVFSGTIITAVAGTGGTTVTTGGLLPPPGGYPPSQCDPATCSPQCCCCITTDIVSEISLNCHEKVQISCDRTGDSPGPGLTDFPATCTECRRACDGIIADSQGLTNSTDVTCSNFSSHDWWHDDPNAICRCECHHRVGPNPTDTCDLTCVFCNQKCSSEFTIESGSTDCSLRATLSPSDGCCGNPAIVDFMFVIDRSGSMGGEIVEIRNQIGSLIQKIADIGCQIRVGLTVFGKEFNPVILINFTQDTDLFEEILASVTVDGSLEYDILALLMALQYGEWLGNSRYLFLIGDEPSQYLGSETKEQVVSLCIDHNIVVFASENSSTERQYIADATGGSTFDINDSFSEIVDSLNITGFPSSCDCIDAQTFVYRDSPECIDPSTGDPIPNAPDHCRDIAIGQCKKQENCVGVCDTPYALFACGHTIVINPIEIGMKCCSDVGFGCDCQEDVPLGQCCGPDVNCDPICDPTTGQPMFNSLELAQDYVWCRCFDKAAYLDQKNTQGGFNVALQIKKHLGETTNDFNKHYDLNHDGKITNSDVLKARALACTVCCCPDESLEPGHMWYPCYKLRDELDIHPEYAQFLNQDPPQCCDAFEEEKNDCCNLCVWLDDGRGTFTRYCKNDIFDQVAAAYASCKDAPISTISWSCPEENCERTDECIIFDSTTADPCAETRDGSGLVKHPSVSILNNGIGLVAYEVSAGLNSPFNIQIEQFHTSSGAKILPNRIFNFGRLQHSSKWGEITINGAKTAKLYYYESVPTHLITGVEA